MYLLGFFNVFHVWRCTLPWLADWQRQLHRCDFEGYPCRHLLRWNSLWQFESEHWAWSRGTLASRDIFRHATFPIFFLPEFIISSRISSSPVSWGAPSSARDWRSAKKHPHISSFDSKLFLTFLVTLVLGVRSPVSNDHKILDLVRLSLKQTWGLARNKFSKQHDIPISHLGVEDPSLSPESWCIWWLLSPSQERLQNEEPAQRRQWPVLRGSGQVMQYAMDSTKPCYRQVWFLGFRRRILWNYIWPRKPHMTSAHVMLWGHLQFPHFRLIEDGDMYASIFNTYLVFFYLPLHVHTYLVRIVWQVTYLCIVCLIRKPRSAGASVLSVLWLGRFRLRPTMERCSTSLWFALLCHCCFFVPSTFLECCLPWIS